MINCSTNEVHNKLIAYGGVNIFDEHIGKHHASNPSLAKYGKRCIKHDWTTPVGGEISKNSF